jgi:hypothetical protein
LKLVEDREKKRKEKKQENKDWKEGYKDSWPVQRVYPLE